MTNERPIIFTGDEVMAILADRKTQKRYIVSPRNSTVLGYSVTASSPMWRGLDFSRAMPRAKMTALAATFGYDNAPDDLHLDVPFRDEDGLVYRVRPVWGVGDRLWVREKIVARPMPNILTGEPTTAIVAAYAADDEDVVQERGFNVCPWWNHNGALPAIRMPRWASRITLEITDVRVQRLQDISADDAVAEGVYLYQPTQDDYDWLADYCTEQGYINDGVLAPAWIAPGTRCGFGLRRDDPLCGPTAQFAFRLMWDSTNAKRGHGWDSNPFVWAISFRRVAV